MSGTAPSTATPDVRTTPAWPGVKAWLQAQSAPGRRGAEPGAWRLLLRRPAGVIGLVALALPVSGALLAGWIYPGDPLHTVAAPLLLPGQDLAYPLGTDSIGRDVAAMLLHGAYTSLSVGLLATVIGLVIGTVFGSLAGYFGGWIDAVLMRVTELFQATPMFLFIVALVALLQPSATMIALAIGLTSWESLARLVRAEFRQMLQSDFVVAARSFGFGRWWIIVREILPNVMPSIIVMISFKVASAIFMESGLAFLGLGDVNTASWGGMINEGRDFIRTAWFLTVVPTAAIILTVLSLNLIGDALNDVLNPRFRRTD